MISDSMKCVRITYDDCKMIDLQYTVDPQTQTGTMKFVPAALHHIVEIANAKGLNVMVVTDPNKIKIMFNSVRDSVHGDEVIPQLVSMDYGIDPLTDTGSIIFTLEFLQDVVALAK